MQMILLVFALGCYWAVLVYQLGAQWSVYDQYHYGWAVPFLCLYLLWRKAETLKAEMLKGAARGKAESRKQKAEMGMQANAETLKAEMLKSKEGLRDRGTTGRQDGAQRTRRSVLWSRSPAVWWSLAALCALVYAAARFLHEANPIWRLTSLLWTAAVIGLTLLTVYIVRSQWSVVSSPQSTVHGPQSAVRSPESRVLSPEPKLSQFQLSAFQRFSISDLVFPVCFFLVAVPWPSGLEGFLVQALMRANVRTTTELLGVLDIPAAQHGNVIEVSTGMVGIDEACSGIRSFQATLMISLFLGELYRLRFSRRLWLVASGFGLAFVFNVGRTLVLTLVASAKGTAAIASWHDPAGVAILVACFLTLWAFSVWLKARQRLESRALSPESKVLRSESKSAACNPSNAFCGPIQGEMNLSPESGVLSPESTVHGPQSTVRSPTRFSIFLLVWLVLVEGGTELWYRSHERVSAQNSEWSVQCPSAGSGYQKVAIPPGILGQFHSDEATQVRWRDDGGNSWQLYYFRWLPEHSLKKRVATLLAKTHGPEKCLPAVGMKLKADLGVITVPVSGRVLALRQYVFGGEGLPVHVFYGIYEDPTGSGELANRRTDNASRVAAALAGSRNYGQRWLEVAVVGFENPADAKAALARELGKVIKVRGSASDSSGSLRLAMLPTSLRPDGAPRFTSTGCVSAWRSAGFQTCCIADFPSAGREQSCDVRVGKPAIQQVGKPALLCGGAR
jgi:exosortase/archaeosortase family protein